MEETSKVTISSIARRLGVSETTVSLVLAGRGEHHRISRSTILRVQRAARDMGYRPNLVARQLAGKKCNVVGVLINTEAVADVRLIQAMEMAAAERGMRFIVGHAVRTREQVKEYLDDFEDRRVDGIISIFHNHPDYSDTVVSELARFANVIFFEKPPGARGAQASYVEPDHYEVGRVATRHLIERGCQRVGLVYNNLVFPYAISRRQGYETALLDAGREVDDGLIWVLDHQPGHRWTDPFTPELARHAMEQVVVTHGADGIVVINDLYAARLLTTLREMRRRVPDDVALIGCDNLEFGTLIDPPLTTIWVRVDLQAEAVINMLFEQLENGFVARERHAILIPPELIIRGTS
jgi:LacI family transcriptional regulator